MFGGCAQQSGDTGEADDSVADVQESLIGTPEVEIFGTLQTIFTDGDFSSNARLNEHGNGQHSFGLGAISGLRGEITIVDGETWLSYPDGSDAITVTNSSGPDEEAALLVTSEVAEWISFNVDTDISYEELTDVLTTILSDSYWPDGVAVPFTISGSIPSVDWHVIDGSLLPDGQASHEDHENASVSGTIVDGSPTLVGFYSNIHAGVITHGGVRIHVHVVDETNRITGHVEDALIKAGSTINFPAPSTSQQ